MQIFATLTLCSSCVVEYNGTSNEPVASFNISAFRLVPSAQGAISNPPILAALMGNQLAVVHLLVWEFHDVFIHAVLYGEERFDVWTGPVQFDEACE